MALELPENFQADDAPAVLDRARSILDLPPDARLHVDDVVQSGRETRIVFSYTVCVELKDLPLPEVADVEVEVTAHGDLRFNAKGNLVACELEPADPRQLRAIRDHIAKLVRSGQVYFAEPGEEVDPERLRKLGKPWYVEQDPDGKKRLVRAWIA